MKILKRTAIPKGIAYELKFIAKRISIEIKAIKTPFKKPINDCFAITSETRASEISFLPMLL